MPSFNNRIIAGVVASFVPVAFAGGASASTVDFTDNVFTSVVHGFAGPIVEFTETVAGVVFTFDATGQFRNVGTWSNGTTNSTAPWALSFGGGGGQTSSWTMTVSQDITLNSFNGIGPLNAGNNIAVFDVTGTGVNSTGNTFTNYGAFGSPGQTYGFNSGPLTLQAGEIYTFTTTNPSANTVSSIYSFDFSVAAVPLPASALLLLGGLGALGALRRRRG